MTVKADFTGNTIYADGFVGGDVDDVAGLSAAVAAAAGVEDIAVTFTSGDAPATDGAVTIADATEPTVVELLALVYELRAEVKAIKTALDI